MAKDDISSLIVQSIAARSRDVDAGGGSAALQRRYVTGIADGGEWVAANCALNVARRINAIEQATFDSRSASATSDIFPACICEPVDCCRAPLRTTTLASGFDFGSHFGPNLDPDPGLAFDYTFGNTPAAVHFCARRTVR
jgi:hypothetical protein